MRKELEGRTFVPQFKELLQLRTFYFRENERKGTEINKEENRNKLQKEKKRNRIKKNNNKKESTRDQEMDLPNCAKSN